MSTDAEMAALRAELEKTEIIVRDLKKDKGPGAPETKAAIQALLALRAKLPQEPKKEKAEKPAAGAAAAAAKAGPKDEGADYFASRVALVNAKGAMGAAYPHVFDVDTNVPTAIKDLSDKVPNKGDRLTQTTRIAGRVLRIRSSGSKMHFIDLMQEGAKMQVVAMFGDWTGLAGADDAARVKGFAQCISEIKRGDIIGVVGCIGRANAGEFSIFAQSVQLLSPCFHMLPDSYYGFSNPETRFRQRYLDFIVNSGNLETFRARSKIISHIRRFFDERDFTEVETPILNMIPGGAAARPFVTHHNDLNQQMFLRIAPELYLKMCIVGGIERVYELGRQFRNEGIDITHNPEFTSIEMYWAYKDYNFLMDMTEQLLRGIAKALHGTEQVHFKPNVIEGTEQVTHKFPEVVLDYGKPFQRLRIIPELEARMGVKFPANFETEECTQWLLAQCQQREIEILPPYTTPRLFDFMIAHYLEPLCVQPTFLIDHPRVMSPLAKWHRDDARLSERFELFVMKKELANAYTELNSPLVQREEFMKQMAHRDKGDDESMQVDETFLQALEHGLPPTAGWGLGIDRLVMFMTNNVSIKEVLLFPAMRHSQNQAVAAASFAPGTHMNGAGVPMVCPSFLKK